MSATIKDQLLEKLNDRSAVVAILGLGYVGLPLAAVFAEGAPRSRARWHSRHR